MGKKVTWNDMGFKDKLSYVLCTTSFVLAAFVFILAICIPPQGIVDSSVLTGIGMFLTFCGSILGISQHYRLELEKIKSTFEGHREKQEED